MRNAGPGRVPRLPGGLALALAACVAVAGGCNRIAPHSPKPNVLFVTIDTLRADHVGVYGADFAATPALDALAARGARFERAFAVTPLTLPSHATLFTGQLPPRHGVRHNGLFQLPEASETLAERFRAAGYRTGAVVGAVVLQAEYGLAQGFQHYDDDAESRYAAAGAYLERSAGEVTERSLQWLEAADGPFFLWVHYYDPHANYAPPAAYGERFPDRPYDGEIAYVDDQLARLLDRLEARGQLSRTVVSVTSDHGESLGEHGEPNHGYGL
ncbi:MAG: sulfatase, partial [Proteobacteria bacterium]|nr:sulfatase [Pseudomonadota bacterium]